MGTGDGLPSNVMAERAFLSLLMRERDAIESFSGRLTPAYFYRYEYRLIYTAMLRLSAKGEAVELVNIVQMLDDNGKLKDAGGIATITDVQQYEMQIPTLNREERLSFLESYAEIITRAYKSREGFKLLRTAALQAKDDDDLNKILETVYSQIEALYTDAVSDDPVPAVQAMLEWLEKNELKRKQGETTGIISGLAELDGRTRGWQDGNLYILAARPNVGKTALACNFMLNAARVGVKVCFFSLEMTREEILDRFVSMLAGVAMDKVSTPSLQTKEEEERAYNASLKYSKLPIFVDDFEHGGRATVANMLAKARRMKRRKELDMVVIDHLHIIASDGRRENRTQELSAMTAGIKRMAKELQVPVICLAQLSRAVEGRNDKRPTLSDLRDSGTIEQDADVVMFLYRDDYYEADEKKQNNLAELNIAKGRNIKRGRINLVFVPEYMRFALAPKEKTVHFAGMASSEQWQKGGIPA